MPSKKVRLDALTDLGRCVDELPPCEPEEVTPREAIRRALPHIYAMQGKGYSLKAIAEFLTKRGIEVGPLALKRYMQLADAGGPKNVRKRQPDRTARELSRASASTNERKTMESGPVPVKTGAAEATKKETPSNAKPTEQPK